MTEQTDNPFPSAAPDAIAAETGIESPQTWASACKRAFADNDFPLRDELRPVRLQLELLGLVAEGAISEEDLDIFQCVDSAGESWSIIKASYGLR